MADTPRFTPLFAIGHGGMGTVEVAVDRSTSPPRIVALKRLLDDVARDKRHAEAFLREARLASLLTHPNVVRAHWAGEQDGRLVLAMDYVEGESLAAVLERTNGEGLAPAIAAYVTACVCDGLHAAHELKDVGGKPLNLVHRDVSPHNVMIGYDGRVLVLDFGVAKIDAGSGLTHTGEVKGKAAYMSPEQGLGDPLDRRSDLYAVGAVLFECIEGRRMWLGDTDMAVLRQLALEDPPRLEKGPEELRYLLGRLVSRDREARPKTALDVGEDLRKTARDTSAHDIAALMADLFADARREKCERLARALVSAAPEEADALHTSVAPTIAEAPRALASRWPIALALAAVAAIPVYFFARPKDSVHIAPPAIVTTSEAPKSNEPAPMRTPSTTTPSLPVTTARAFLPPRSSASSSASALSSSKPPLDVDPHPF